MNYAEKLRLKIGEWLTLTQHLDELRAFARRRNRREQQWRRLQDMDLAMYHRSVDFHRSHGLPWFGLRAKTKNRALRQQRRDGIRR